MALRLNQGAENVRATEKEEIKSEHDQEVTGGGANINKGYFPDKKGSVFPAKRKLVKTMMADCVVKSLSSLSISPEAASSKMGGGGPSKMTAPSKFSEGKKRMGIYPDL